MVYITLYSRQLSRLERCSFCGTALSIGDECVVVQDPFVVYCLECGLRAAQKEAILVKERIKDKEKMIINLQSEIDKLEKVAYKNKLNKIKKIEELIEKNV